MEGPTSVRAIVVLVGFLVGACSAALIQYLVAARDPVSCAHQAVAGLYASPACIQPTHYLSLDLIAGVLCAVIAWRLGSHWDRAS